ncbi:gp53-like domain-containing protein [Escherichia coli]|uniref:gp53-like domain-containing protein n=1 Tax=Escherichia coli TaxID=562 RepID=UPI003C6D1CA1
MPAFEWVHVQLHQQKGMISLSPPTICNSANLTTVGVVNSVPVTFPVPFPVNCWGVFSTKLTWVQITNSCEWVSNTGFTAQVMMNIAVNTNTSDAMFLAIGY